MKIKKMSMIELSSLLSLLLLPHIDLGLLVTFLDIDASSNIK